MNIYDEPTAPGGEFTDGDPLADPVVPRTVLRSIWTNMIQRELINLVEGAGLTLNGADFTQVLQAVQQLDSDLSTDLTADIATAKAEAIAAADSALLARRHTSSEQTITLGGTVNSAHGFGTRPYSFTVFIRCKTAEHGYAVGDEIQMGIQAVHSSGTPVSHFGIQAYANATNVGAIIGASGVDIYDKPSGAFATITPANWRIVLIANK